jgi:hypothetical protein
MIREYDLINLCFGCHLFISQFGNNIFCFVRISFSERYYHYIGKGQ